MSVRLWENEVLVRMWGLNRIMYLVRLIILFKMNVFVRFEKTRLW